MRHSTLLGIIATTAMTAFAPFASAQKADVWDFGAAQLDASAYNNHLTEDFINGLYGSDVAAGTSGKAFVSTFTSDILTWTGGSNDRLRTTNTALTRYDNNGSGKLDGESFAGLLYINASAATGRYFTLTLAEDDEVNLYVKSQNGNGQFHFEGGNGQSDVVAVGNSLVKIGFTAQAAGSYKIYESADKPSYFRIVRRPASYTAVSGAVSTTSTLPEGTAIRFTNEAGKAWLAPVSDGAYSVSLPQGHSYALSLDGASQFVITSDKSLTTSGSTQSFNISVSDIALATLSGNITGLPTAQIARLALQFTPTDASKPYAPAATIAADGSYTVDLEQGVAYTLTATGVNDYSLVNPTMSVTAATTADIAFAAKPTYAVTVAAEGLTAEQQAALTYSFKNLNEAGYSYSFGAGEEPALRDGVYSLTVGGLDKLPLVQALTSNVKVAGAAVTKAVSFKQATEWPFDDAVITSSTAWYRGAQLSGNIANEQAKGHLVGKEGATFRLPMNPNEKAVVTFYYSANFSIDGGDAVTATTSKGSTSKTESVEYRYAGTEPGYATITFGSGSTYLTHIAVKPVVAYAATLRVGPQETYTTINDALEAVRCMERNATDRVEILIAPGNYEEMLVIDVPNVSLTNASATPSLALKNKGVDIDAEAVRITSYYGHGYHYYSMNNQKWDAEVLRVNKENGYRSYDNVGGGTTNASYWNATVVITAEGFEAHNIIFENSYNQYISAKEADDVVEEWATGGKGTRPTTAGSTAVQAKSYVERAAAVAIANNTDRTVFDNCRIIGRQDSFFGGINSRMAFYKGCVMGAVDYIFGGMVAAFYQTELQFNTSDDKNDTGYITAAQQTSGRGYLMYECSVTSTKPGVETASSYESKPGCFGRPWAAQTAEVVFYNTKVNATSHPDYKGKSLISAAGWSSSLSGESALCGEYGTTELSGEDNSSKRASWAQQFTAPQLADGTEITLYNFTKGTDGWDPFAALIDRDGTSIGSVNGADAAQVRLTVDGSTLRLAGLGSAATVSVYTAEGALRAQAQAADTYAVVLPAGIYVVRAQTAEGVAVMKAAVR